MEKENFQKYYEIIANLVKEHRKYSGLESVLDDIVADVYEHAKIVLETVTNEDVVVSYLKKVVATSIITVPKRKNIQVKDSKVHPTIDLTRVERQEESIETGKEDSVTEDELPELTLEEQTEEDLLSEEGDEFEEVVDVPAEAIDKIEEVAVETEYLESTNPDVENDEFDNIENIAESSLGLDNDLTPELELAELDSDETEAIEVQAEVVEEAHDVDMSLVDKMINGVDVIEEIKEFDIESNEEQTIDVTNDTLGDELVEEVELIENSYTEIDNNSDEDDNIDSSNDIEVQELATVEDVEIETNDNIELLTDTVEALELNEDLSLNDDSDGVSFDLDSDISDDLIESTNESLDFHEDFDENSSINAEDEILEVEPVEILENDDVQIEELENVTESGKMATDSILESVANNYNKISSCFDFESENLVEEINNYYDGDKIGAELLDLDKSYPQYQILNVFRLRFVEGKSLEAISNELEIELNTIIDILNVIIDIVKD